MQSRVLVGLIGWFLPFTTALFSPTIACSCSRGLRGTYENFEKLFLKFHLTRGSYRHTRLRTGTFLYSIFEIAAKQQNRQGNPNEISTLST